jgi:hypothetical protein
VCKNSDNNDNNSADDRTEINADDPTDMKGGAKLVTKSAVSSLTFSSECQVV